LRWRAMGLLGLMGRGRPLITIEARPSPAGRWPLDPGLLGLMRRADAVVLTALRDSAPGSPCGPSGESARAAIWAHRELGLAAIPTITCRDYPRSDRFELFAALIEGGIETVLVVRGDPSSGPGRDVYDYRATWELIGDLRAWERSRARGGDGPGGLEVAVQADPTAEDQGLEIERLRRKRDSGASIAFTQPEFDADRGLRFLDRIEGEGLGMAVVMGLLAMRGPRSPGALEARLGIRIPAAVKDRMARGGPGEGVRIALELYRAFRDRVDGFHLYSYGGPEALSALLDGISAIG
jgi:5,10-methylenetetrahydrofolate reductase